MSPANRPLPPLPDEAETQRQQIRPRPAPVPPSSSPLHDRSKAEKAPPSQAITVATAAAAVPTRPRVPRMGTWSPHSLHQQQQPRESGEVLLSNPKLESLKAQETGIDGLRGSRHVHSGSLRQSSTSAAAAAKCAATTAGVAACAPERRSWELHTLSIPVRKPGEVADDLLVRSVPTEHAYAEYLTIPPRPPNSQTSTLPVAGSDDGYTSLNNPPSEGEGEYEQPKNKSVDGKEMVDPPQHHRRTSRRRRRVRVLVKRAPRPSSSSCRWSSTSDGGATIYGGYYAANQGPQQLQNHHRRQHRRHHHQQQHKRRPDVARAGEAVAGALDSGYFESVEATTVSCIDDLYRLRLRRVSGRHREDSKEQQWQQQPHSAKTHRMNSRRKHRSPSYTTRIPDEHHPAGHGRSKHETAATGTGVPSVKQSTRTPASPSPLANDAPSTLALPEDSSLLSLTRAPSRRHRRSSSCRCHCSQRLAQVCEKAELQAAGCQEADLVYEVVRSDTETTATNTERDIEDEEDLQPLLAVEEGTGATAAAVAYAKRFLYSNSLHYPGNGTLPAVSAGSITRATARQANATSRPRRSANTLRRRPMQYDSCTMVTMLVV
ncbi:hypothetical protein AAHC03_022840 [Spirometra sp. Aus1]